VYGLQLMNGMTLDLNEPVSAYMEAGDTILATVEPPAREEEEKSSKSTKTTASGGGKLPRGRKGLEKATRKAKSSVSATTTHVADKKKAKTNHDQEGGTSLRLSGDGVRSSRSSRSKIESFFKNLASRLALENPNESLSGGNTVNGVVPNSPPPLPPPPPSSSSIPTTQVNAVNGVNKDNTLHQTKDIIKPDQYREPRAYEEYDTSYSNNDAVNGYDADYNKQLANNNNNNNNSVIMNESKDVEEEESKHVHSQPLIAKTTSQQSSDSSTKPSSSKPPTSMRGPVPSLRRKASVTLDVDWHAMPVDAQFEEVVFSLSLSLSHSPCLYISYMDLRMFISSLFCLFFFTFFCLFLILKKKENTQSCTHLKHCS
jgi:hypothetical protein